MNSPFFPWKGWQERNASLEIQLCIDPWQMFWKYSLLCCRSWHVTFTGPVARDVGTRPILHSGSSVFGPDLLCTWTSLLIPNVQILPRFCPSLTLSLRFTLILLCGSILVCLLSHATFSLSPREQNRHCWVLLPQLEQASSWSCLSSAQPRLLQCIVTIVCKAFWRINKN